MKLWLLTSEFPPDFAGGGIGTYAIEAASAWRGAGHDVVVFALGASTRTRLEEEIGDGGITVVRVPPSAGSVEHDEALGHWHRVSFGMAEAVVARLRAGTPPPDVIEVQDFAALGFFLLKRKLCLEPMLAGIPIVVVTHTPAFELFGVNETPAWQFPRYWIGRSERFALLAADQVISPSTFLYDRLAAETGRSDIEVQPYPMRLLPAAARDETRCDTDLLYLGRFELRKGVMELVTEMAALWDAGHAIHLTMIGGDTDWNARGEKVRDVIERGYRNFIDMGLLTLRDQVPLDALPEIIARAKAVVVPSLYENYPYIGISAMAAAVPVLASSSGGHAEMVGSDGRCGRVFDLAMPGDLGRAVLELMALSVDERVAMGAAARARIAAITEPSAYVARRVAQTERAIASARESRRTYPFLNQVLPAERDRLPAYAPPDVPAGEKERLTVIVPYYNLGAYLRETIESAMQTDYAATSVLIVDDGSTDAESIRVLAELEAATWPLPLSVLRVENRGLAGARNLGAETAQSEFIAFLDADDKVRPSYYRRAIELLDAYPNASFAYAWARFFDREDILWANFDTELPYLLVANMTVPMQVMRRHDYLRFGRNDPTMAYGLEDHEAWLRLAGNGCLGISIPEPLIDYRVREGSMSRVWHETTRVLMWQQIASRNRELYDRWGAEVYQLLNANGPGRLWKNPSLEHGPVGHLESDSQSQMAALRFKFSRSEALAIAALLKEPAAVWLVRAMMKSGVHKAGIGLARALFSLRRLVPGRRKESEDTK